MKNSYRQAPAWLPPRPRRGRLATISNLEANLTAKLGRTPTDGELASMLAMPLQRLRRLRGS
ncbi:MAG: sigma-70 domain-containing protein [Rhodopila sp.]